MKKLLITVAALSVILLGTVLFITKDTGPTHPVLRAAELPPLIPTRAFYADPRSASGYVASSDGKFVSFEKASLTGRSIVVKNLVTNDEISIFPIGLGNIR